MSFPGKLPPWHTNIPALEEIAAQLSKMAMAINTLLPMTGIDGVEVNQVWGRGTVIRGVGTPGTITPQGTFPVLLTYGSSPGADGTSTTAATWAYTFYDVSDPGLTTPKGTNQQPAPPRPLGSMTRQPASVANTSYSYGLACNGVAGAVILLTAYEQPNMGAC